MTAAPEVLSDVLILGAGAIGRGYLPWCLPGCRLVFVDKDERLVSLLQSRRRYRTYRAREGKLESLEVEVGAAATPEAFTRALCPSPAAIFVNVGPRHVAAASALLRGYDCPIILCENDPATVPVARAAASAERVYFAVPDVITSSCAPPALLAEDPLSVVTEDGVLFLDERALPIPGVHRALSSHELLHTQWTAKLFLHNTPHCVAAYLGALAGVDYMHEAMAIPQVAQIAAGAMDEMLSCLKLRWEIPHPFLDWYAEKELARFKNPLLFDPIARVAREPLRKLDLGGRLLGAAQICLASGLVPQHLIAGIGSALLFSSQTDADHHLGFLRGALSPGRFLTHILGLREGEALEIVLREQLPTVLARLEQLRPGQVPPLLVAEVSAAEGGR